MLDTDLYKLTMQQAVLEHFPDVVCTYTFTNRTKTMLFNQACVDLVVTSVHRLSEIRLTAQERVWLEATCPYFKSTYLDKLASLRLRPEEQVKFQYVPSVEDPNWGQLEITVGGLWWQTILYEVPIMSLLSEMYFKTVDKDWSYEGQLGAVLHLMCFEQQTYCMASQRKPMKKEGPCFSITLLSANLAPGDADRIIPIFLS